LLAKIWWMKKWTDTHFKWKNKGVLKISPIKIIIPTIKREAGWVCFWWWGLSCREAGGGIRFLMMNITTATTTQPPMILHTFAIITADQSNRVVTLIWWLLAITRIISKFLHGMLFMQVHCIFLYYAHTFILIKMTCGNL